MTKLSRVSGDFRSRAVVCLRAALAAGIVAVTMPAVAAPQPMHYAQAHEAVTHHGRAHRMLVQTTPDSGAAKSSKPDVGKGSAHKAKSGTKSSAKSSAKSSTKSRRRKARPQEADNDPLVLHRAAGRRRQRGVEPREVADVPHKGQKVVAEVSAAPEPVTPAGKATLPEKLHNAATAMKTDAKSAFSRHGRARPSVLPEDHAGKVAVIEQAMTPMVLPTLYTRHGRLIVPPPMKGTHEILVHQNEMAESEGLDRIQDDDDLDRLRDLHLLVELPESGSLRVNEELPENRRYARPWAARFAADMARGFYSRFHQPLHLNSAVRTVEYQLRLQHVNGNAAAVDGDGASPHLTGQALDFGKRGMSTTQIAWMRAYLAPLMHAGKIDVEEEFQQACFHISVYRSYAPILKPKAKVDVARVEGPVGGASTGDSLR